MPSAMPRIIFLNRYFHPDQSATSQMLSDLAFDLGGRGHDVHVITSRQRYESRERLPAEETFGGVRIHRVVTTHFGRDSLPGRVCDYISFYLSARRTVLALARENDIVVAKTDPPLLSVAVAGAARKRKAKLINWLQDLYPEIAQRLGVPLMDGAFGRTLTKTRDRALAQAVANIVPSKSMAANVRAANGIHVINNWTDDERIAPIRIDDNPLREAWGLRGKFVVSYSGNLGRAHDFATMLDAAERLRDDPRVVFLVIGGGKLASELERQAAARGLQASFRFLPYQDRGALKFSLGAADVHWLSLKPGTEGFIFPSKLYGIAAAGRPILAIAAKDGEIAALLTRHECGVTIAPGDGAALAREIARLARDPERCAQLGQAARHMLESEFTKAAALEKWRGLLEPHLTA